MTEWRPPKCMGCRCAAPAVNRKCGCCGAWPAELRCVVCGRPGRFDRDMLSMPTGPTHDGCAALEGRE